MIYRPSGHNNQKFNQILKKVCLERKSIVDLDLL